VITEEAKAWVVHLACSKPKEHGYAAELWTRSSLALHVRQHAEQAGHPSLAKAVKATVHRILAAQELHPERVQYYLEKRDPEFEAKMKDILLVYQEVALQNERQADGATARIITVSVDEKPGLQALANTAPDLPPVARKHPTVGRDHEYKRLGTCSILAWTPGMRPTAPFDWSSTTTRHTSRKKRGPSWLPARIASSMC
jgi:hypothetical protein